MSEILGSPCIASLRRLLFWRVLANSRRLDVDKRRTGRDLLGRRVDTMSSKSSRHSLRMAINAAYASASEWPRWYDQRNLPRQALTGLTFKLPALHASLKRFSLGSRFGPPELHVYVHNGDLKDVEQGRGAVHLTQAELCSLREFIINRSFS